MNRLRRAVFSRDQWAQLRDNTPLTLSEAELARLRGIDDQVALDEVAEVYLPLSRLLNLAVGAAGAQMRVTDMFLGRMSRRVPYVIGIAGSVAVGKSTTSRVLRALLGRWPDTPTVELVTTDGFLYPNAELERRGLMERKGFPESYDRRALLEFVADVKEGKPEVSTPVYSHVTYDIVPGERKVVSQPDILLVEGLNVLQPAQPTEPGPFVSDFFDFSIYVDAAGEDVERWYISRFLTLRDTVFSDPASYFHHYADLTEREAVDTARSIWRRINAVNLRENILPTRDRAMCVLRKGPSHEIEQVSLREW